MADENTSNLTPVHIQYTNIPRLSVRDNTYTVWYMDVLDMRSLAVAGYNNKTDDTFIDLFTLNIDSDSKEKPALMTSQPYYSKEFISGGPYQYRSVSLLDHCLFLTCSNTKIELYNTEHGCPVKQRNINGVAWCMTTRDERVYVSLYISKEVIVFDLDLNQIKTITLIGMKDGDGPWDMTVICNDKLFICTYPSRRALMYNSNGYLEEEYKEPNKQYTLPLSVTVSEENGLIYILWADVAGNCAVGAYSLSGGHYLATFHVPVSSQIIRINNNVNRLFVVTGETGEVYEYHTSGIISFSILLTSLESIFEIGDCQKLLNYFKVSSENSKTIIDSGTPSSSLIQHLRKTGKVTAIDTSYLMKACSDQGISKAVKLISDYQNNQSQKVVETIHAIKLEKQQLSDQLKQSEDERQRLADQLKQMKIQEVSDISNSPSTIESPSAASKLSKFGDVSEGTVQVSDISNSPTTIESPSSSSNLSKIVVVGEDTLQYLSQEICDEWMDVGRILELPEAALLQINEDNNKHKERVYQMLLKWKRRNGRNADPVVLGKALIRVGRKDLQEKFCEEGC